MCYSGRYYSFIGYPQNASKSLVSKLLTLLFLFEGFCWLVSLEIQSLVLSELLDNEFNFFSEERALIVPSFLVISRNFWSISECTISVSFERTKTVLRNDLSHTHLIENLQTHFTRERYSFMILSSKPLTKP